MKTQWYMWRLVLVVLLGIVAFGTAVPATAIEASSFSAIVHQDVGDTAIVPRSGEQPLTEPPAASRQAGLDAAMRQVNRWISEVFYFDLLWGNPDFTFPLVVTWLVVAAIFLTLRMRFSNARGSRHAIAVTWGRFTDPDEPGEVSHFQALTTALSATVGLGDIARVAIASQSMNALQETVPALVYVEAALFPVDLDIVGEVRHHLVHEIQKLSP